MIFTDNQIQLAIKLKSAGLPWQPKRGQFAFDVNGAIRPTSPFQKGVYYFLDFPCFVDYFGSVERLAQSMIWLPTFEEARLLLTSQMDWSCLGAHLERGTELEYLYLLILTDLNRHR